MTRPGSSTSRNDCSEGCKRPWPAARRSSICGGNKEGAVAAADNSCRRKKSGRSTAESLVRDQTASRESRLRRLELHASEGARAVLRGGGVGDSASLPDPEE